jgi:epoxyqueuosine reductase
MSSEQFAVLRQAIERQASHLGFDLLGVTTPDPPPHYDVFTSWLAAGRHGEMAYLAAERSLVRRADPRQILPECRSILVLGARYSPSIFPVYSGLGKVPVTGKVAAYAWGADYHEVLATRLKALVDFIEAQVGTPVPNRWYTDTGPLLERDLAQRAGLGWIGKNTCLINPHLGSYFFLAEILLGLDLPGDPPFIFDRCGACTRCLQACPTSCILPDRTIDARRCLSYLTIELKGSVPPELRPLAGEWVFGCDICQQVCPWNIRFAATPVLSAPPALLAPPSIPIALPEFAARPGVPQPDLLQELALSTDQFSCKFKDSPVKRARRGGYLRNVAVTLGSLGLPAAVSALAQSLAGDPEPLVRSHAAWALGQLGGSEALQALSASARVETDADVLREIQSAETRLRLAG